MSTLTPEDVDYWLARVAQDDAQVALSAHIEALEQAIVKLSVDTSQELITNLRRELTRVRAENEKLRAAINRELAYGAHTWTPAAEENYCVSCDSVPCKHRWLHEALALHGEDIDKALADEVADKEMT